MIGEVFGVDVIASFASADNGLVLEVLSLLTSEEAADFSSDLLFVFEFEFEDSFAVVLESALVLAFSVGFAGVAAVERFALTALND